MKIGIFDSGLGGLIITHSLIQHFPHYDYLYLGDTARVPYGNRSHEAIYQFTKEAVDYLFNQNCVLIIIAYNTASAEALPRIQQEYLPSHFPNRRVLGVLVPTAEEAVSRSKGNHFGIIAINSTVSSQAYGKEILKLLPSAQISQQATPLLVPLIECNATKWAPPILEEYLAPLLEKHIGCLILGCTRCPFLKKKSVRF